MNQMATGIPNTADVKVVALLYCLMAINGIPEASTTGLIETLTQYKPDDDDDSSQETSAAAEFDVVELAIRSMVMLSLRALEHRKAKPPIFNASSQTDMHY
jgi:hypothetical protein